MRESQYSLQIEARGEVKRARADLLKGLSIRLKSPVPEPVRLAIEGTNDLKSLERWFEAVFEVSSWSEFEPRMKQP